MWWNARDRTRSGCRPASRKARGGRLHRLQLDRRPAVLQHLVIDREVAEAGVALPGQHGDQGMLATGKILLPLQRRQEQRRERR